MIVEVNTIKKSGNPYELQEERSYPPDSSEGVETSMR